MDVCCEVVVLFDNTTNHSTAIQNSKRLWLEYLFNATSLIEDGSEVFRLLARCVVLVVVSEESALAFLIGGHEISRMSRMRSCIAETCLLAPASYIVTIFWFATTSKITRP